MRILLVENHEDSAVAIARILTKKGHEVDSAASAADAMRLCDGGRSYDLLISDIGLPDLDGWSLVEKIRGECVPRAIALTGHARAADVERSRAAGFDAHLNKPVDMAKLLATIAEMAA